MMPNFKGNERSKSVTKAYNIFGKQQGNPPTPTHVLPHRHTKYCVKLELLEVPHLVTSQVGVIDRPSTHEKEKKKK